MQGSGSDPGAALSALLALDREHPSDPEIREGTKNFLVDLEKKREGKALSPAVEKGLLSPLEAAVSAGFPDAATLLGRLTREGDPAASLKWFLSAAEQGNRDAMVEAGQMLAAGKGAAEDTASAAAWFRRAADLGDANGMFFLGECFLNGLGVGKDPARAVQWLTKAAENNNPYAMNLLGDLYKKGLPGVLDPNFAEAFRLFSAASGLGYLDAQGNLGVLYINGQGVEKNEAAAVELFRDGAEKGNPSCMFFYAQSLENGDGTRKDPEAAKRWYLRAANGGNQTAIKKCQEKYNAGFDSAGPP